MKDMMRKQRNNGYIWTVLGPPRHIVVCVSIISVSPVAVYIYIELDLHCACRWPSTQWCLVCGSHSAGKENDHKFLPEASFGLWVLSLPASVCVCQFVCQSLACPRDNFGPVEARITKFGPKVQNNLVKATIVLWSKWPWPSRSNIRSKSQFTPLWACPYHNSSHIQARITKFWSRGAKYIG